MDETDRPPPSRIMRKRGGPGRHHDPSASGEDDGGGSEDSDTVECTGKHCRSCTGAAVADCVALCCCPCAVVNLLTLAFIKVPWMVGRRCLRRLWRRQRKKRRERIEVTEKCRCRRSFSGWGDSLSEGMIEFTVGFGLEERVGRQSFCGGGSWFEAEKGGWLELYPVGHLSFGRVSFTGIQLQPAKI